MLFLKGTFSSFTDFLLMNNFGGSTAFSSDLVLIIIPFDEAK